MSSVKGAGKSRSKVTRRTGKGRTVKLAAPKMKYEMNLNTALVAVTLAVTIIGWGVTWGQNDQKVTNLGAADTAITARLTPLEETARKFDNLAYRMTVQEQGSANISSLVRELQAAVNAQSADIRVIREILVRVDSTPSARRSLPAR